MQKLKNYFHGHEKVWALINANANHVEIRMVENVRENAGAYDKMNATWPMYPGITNRKDKRASSKRLPCQTPSSPSFWRKTHYVINGSRVRKRKNRKKRAGAANVSLFFYYVRRPHPGANCPDSDTLEGLFSQTEIPSKTTHAYRLQVQRPDAMRVTSPLVP
ncbi:unnamed protein product [Caenorhabditis auriculariae]|uniref:Uncharacterized protein n=1 Tax=Caenorhabditis auriculariae TaxID=2777116 RepID=A0A8S1HK34_9PELO|nr:unnamed protein product [Caenorhabditis auriculariae]